MKWIDNIMYQFGYISEKMLIEIVVDEYNKNDVSNATDEKDFYFRCGNSNALGYICGKLNIDLTKIIMEINKQRLMK